MSERPLRSWLYVPADDPRKIAKAAASKADVAILDLEDGCPAERKAAGRDCVASALAGEDFGATRRYVRINPTSGPHWRADLEATGGRADGYVIAKASRPSSVATVAAWLRSHRGGEADPDVAPVVTEDVAGVFAADATIAADPMVGTVIWGTEDLSASLGAWSVLDERDELLEVFQVVRSLVLLLARRRAKRIIDTPHLRIGDLEGLAAQARSVARMGFTGKQAIHPSHIAVINDAFVPGEAELRAARELVAAFEDADAAVVRVQDGMQDAPHLLRARTILALADAAGGEHERERPR
ncbi:MAG TPA: CoA ester lyase [Solirubrobacteraceae bacterium]|nr:CoA ester lyase [Solirubrobacteraceae bacterium]